jgi:hypothetical protein
MSEIKSLIPERGCRAISGKRAREQSSKLARVELLNELQALHCNLYLHQQPIDTTTPSGKAMFQMCGVLQSLSAP